MLINPDGNRKINLLISTFQESNIGFTIIDTTITHNPIVYINKGFTQMTGYKAEEVIGRSFTFLFGESTDRDTISTILDAFKRNIFVSLEIINYRKDGTMYWNELNIDPIYVEEENKNYFICFHRDISHNKVGKVSLLSHN
jgi:PAS domain S-box-containing protein